MNVLLFADLSGFQQALRDGLARHGVDVTLASSGDGFKAIEGADFQLGSHPDWGRARRMMHQASILRLFAGHDVVQFVNPMRLADNRLINKALLRYIRAANKRMFSAVCSIDHQVYAAYRSGALRQGPYDGARDDEGSFRLDEDSLNATRPHYDDFIAAIDGVIPISADYAIPYAGHPKMLGMIPAPIRTDTLEYRPNLPASGRIVFQHGIQRGREGFKGTRTIVAALDWLKETYPADVEVLYPSNLPFVEYREVLYRSNVVIDQCNSLAPGLNGLQAMAMGRIVLSGSSSEHLASLGLDRSPLVPIVNDIGVIKSALVTILDNRSGLQEHGEQSRTYVERHHDYVAVAGRYIDRWSQR